MYIENFHDLSIDVLLLLRPKGIKWTLRLNVTSYLASIYNYVPPTNHFQLLNNSSAASSSLEHFILCKLMHIFDHFPWLPLTHITAPQGRSRSLESTIHSSIQLMISIECCIVSITNLILYRILPHNLAKHSLH